MSPGTEDGLPTRQVLALEKKETVKEKKFIKTREQHAMSRYCMQSVKDGQSTF